MMRRMDAVIATGAASAAYLKVPHTVIMHGIDTDRYAPPSDRAAAFAATGLPGRYGIGCFGRVRAQKGTDLFVEAMCRLLPAYPDFCAVIVGEVTPDQRGFAAGLKEQAKAAGLAGRILFLGELPIDEVPLWYQRVLIYAFTSRNEGFGLTLLEAMAAENALVAARAGAAEKVVRDGDTGCLVPTGDAAALAAALEPLLRDPARAATMGARARESVLAQFGVDAEADKIVAVYRDVFARH
jgi:mannosyltransferase